MRKSYIWLAAVFAASASICGAQTLPGIGQLPGGGLPDLSGGLAGGLLPNVASSSIGNLTGVLGYCIKNKFLGGNAATSVLKGLS